MFSLRKMCCLLTLFCLCQTGIAQTRQAANSTEAVVQYLVLNRDSLANSVVDWSVFRGAVPAEVKRQFHRQQYEVYKANTTQLPLAEQLSFEDYEPSADSAVHFLDIDADQDWDVVSSWENLQRTEVYLNEGTRFHLDTAFNSTLVRIIKQDTGAFSLVFYRQACCDDYLNSLYYGHYSDRQFKNQGSVHWVNGLYNRAKFPTKVQLGAKIKVRADWPLYYNYTIADKIMDDGWGESRQESIRAGIIGVPFVTQFYGIETDQKKHNWYWIVTPLKLLQQPLKRLKNETGYLLSWVQL